MFQTIATRQDAAPALPAGRAIPLHYSGPERRATSAALGSCLAGMLDEIDYGMLLVGADAQPALGKPTPDLAASARNRHSGGCFPDPPPPE